VTSGDTTTRGWYDEPLLLRFVRHDGELPDEEGQEVVSRPDLVREVAKIMMGLAQDDLPTTENSTMTTSVRDEKGAPVSVSTLAFHMEWR